MGDYFKGWRRKCGLLTLMMACVAMGGWVRSRDTFDELQINTAPWRYVINSGIGLIQLAQMSHLEGKPRFNVLSFPIRRRDGKGMAVGGFYVDKKVFLSLPLLAKSIGDGIGSVFIYAAESMKMKISGFAFSSSPIGQSSSR